MPNKISLFYPVKPAFVNQGFGASPNAATNAIYLQQGLKGHPGIDFQASHGQPVYAAMDGTCYPEIDSNGGNGVLIRTAEWQCINWHFIKDNAVVQTGQVVKAGDLIGYADSTGISTGDHLHFGMLPLVNTDKNNGFNGCVDPTPYFNGMFAQDINPLAKFQFTQTLKYGSWNADVKQLQTLLEAQNYPLGVIDGIFGVKTQTAVKTFQIAHNLVPDGIVGPKTNQVLNSLL